MGNVHFLVWCWQRWSHAERLMALDELMEKCEPTQVRHVMQVIEPQFQRDFISLLPKEVHHIHFFFCFFLSVLLNAINDAV